MKGLYVENSFQMWLESIETQLKQLEQKQKLYSTLSAKDLLDQTLLDKKNIFDQLKATESKLLDAQKYMPGNTFEKEILGLKNEISDFYKRQSTDSQRIIFLLDQISDIKSELENTSQEF